MHASAVLVRVGGETADAPRDGVPPDPRSCLPRGGMRDGNVGQPRQSRNAASSLAFSSSGICSSVSIPVSRIVARIWSR